MNRAERRKQPKKYISEQVSPTCDVSALQLQGYRMQEGDKFTIAGMKKTKTGWIHNCKPGEETIMRAGKTVSLPSPILPAVLPLVDSLR